MTDTVTRLMELADKAIAAQDQRLGCLAQDYREALQDELTKLFAPLSDEKKPNNQPCVLCGGAFELDYNGYTTFSRCIKCRHVPLFHNGVDVAARVRENGTGETK